MSVNQNQNKIIISSLSILTPQLNKTFYISIIINETKPLKTKIIEFQTTAEGEPYEQEKMLEIFNIIVYVTGFVKT